MLYYLVVILIVAHDTLFPSGTLKTLLERRGTAHRTLRLHLGDPIPDDVRRFKGIVSLGGTMSAADERNYPFLRDEAMLLRSAVAAGVPVLGISLGARVLARALGGRSHSAPVAERGWAMVHLTPAGRRDQLFAGVGSPLQAFHWHGECLVPPPGAELLATADCSRNQAFRFAMAWGIQFHPEVDPGIMDSLSIGTEEYVELRRLQPLRLPLWRRRARTIFNNFLTLAACGARSS